MSNNQVNKRTSTSSRKKYLTQGIEAWKDNNKVSPLQTPKHSGGDCKMKISSLGKLFKASSPNSPTYRQKMLNNYNSQPNLFKISKKRRSNSKASMARIKSGIYMNKAYYLNGKKLF